MGANRGSNDFSAVLRWAITRHGNQTEFAKLAGFSRSTLQSVLAGKAPTWRTASQILAGIAALARRYPEDTEIARAQARLENLWGSPGNPDNTPTPAEPRHRDFLSQDDEALGVFMLYRWSLDQRPLVRDLRKHRLEYGEPPAQDWFEPELLRAAQRRQEETKHGDVGFVCGMTLDHGEHEQADAFVLRVAKSRYGDLNAIGDCLKDQDMAMFVQDRLREKGAADFLASMPPTRLSIQVAILTAQRHVLALQRSFTEESCRGDWQLGPNETLRTDATANPVQSLFDLAELCLKNECDLVSSASPPEIGPIHITWFGVTAKPDEGVAQNVLAMTTCRLQETELARRIQTCDENHEHLKQPDWIPFNLQDLAVLTTDVVDRSVVRE